MDRARNLDINLNEARHNIEELEFKLLTSDSELLNLRD
jgi:hypothetical protein